MEQRRQRTPGTGRRRGGRLGAGLPAGRTTRHRHHDAVRGGQRPAPRRRWPPSGCAQCSATTATAPGCRPPRMTDKTRAVFGGVNTHADRHEAAALDERGRLLGVATFATTVAGHQHLLDWLRGFGALRQAGRRGGQRLLRPGPGSRQRRVSDRARTWAPGRHRHAGWRRGS